jgi:DNA-binding HxlR family transcriptional regulator
MNWASTETLAGITYLVFHFCAYAFWLRRKDFFQREIGIFLYHFISAALFAFLLLSASLIHQVDAAAAVALVATHGIYSISFLELWSLSEGSYSVSILNELARGPARSKASLINACSQIGSTKKADRLQNLSRFGIAFRREDCWRLTTRGRYLASVLQALNWLTVTKQTG